MQVKHGQNLLNFILCYCYFIKTLMKLNAAQNVQQTFYLSLQNAFGKLVIFSYFQNGCLNEECLFFFSQNIYFILQHCKDFIIELLIDFD